jgi:hypothetical protein
MRRAVLYFFLAAAMLSCKGFSDFGLGVPLFATTENRLIALDLNRYELFVRQIARAAPPPGYLSRKAGDRYGYSAGRFNVEDSPYASRAEIERLEIDYLLISKADKRVILISTLPPYAQNGKIVYDYALFDSDNVVNINYFNYFKFGTVEDRQLFFGDDNPMHVTYRIAGNELFLSTIITPKETHDLGTSFPISTKYVKKTNWDIMFHREVQPEDAANTYFTGNLTQRLTNSKQIYYDPLEHQVYFHLLDYQGVTRWISFATDRVKAKFRL